MENNDPVPEQPADSQPFSKQNAARYLGVSVRKLEDAMAKQTILHEKHGRKVVFRRTHLEAYLRAMLISHRGTGAPKFSVPSAASTSDSAKARTILGVDLESLICDLRRQARRDRRLTREGVKTMLTKMAGLRDADAEQRLAAYEAAAACAVQNFPSIFGPHHVNRMDWSYAVADAFLQRSPLDERHSPRGPNREKHKQKRTKGQRPGDVKKRQIGCASGNRFASQARDGQMVEEIGPN